MSHELIHYSLVDFEEKLNREEKSFVEDPENACLFPADDKSNSIESDPDQGKAKANTAKNQKEVSRLPLFSYGIHA